MTRLVCASCLSTLLLSCATPEGPPSRPTVFPDLRQRAALLVGDEDDPSPVVTEQLYAGPSQNSVLVRVEAPIPLHVHRGSEETVHMLQGSGTLHLARGEELAVKAGDFVVVPRGVPHGFEPDEGPDALVLSIFSPPLGEGDRVPVDRDGEPIAAGRDR